MAINSIQALRFLAVFGVVLNHTLSKAGISFLPGTAGVDLFFVISGFIIAYSVDRNKDHPRLFLLKRAIRVLPLYWVYTSMMVALLLVAPQMFGHLKFSLSHTLDSYLLLPTINTIGERRPVLNVGWTLSYEMLYYCCFAALLGLRRMVAFYVLLTIFLTTTCAGLFLVQPNTYIYFITNAIFLEFLLGFGLFLLYKNPSPLPPFACLIAIIASITFFIAGMLLPSEADLWKVCYYGLPAALLMIGLLYLERQGKLFIPTFMRFLGDASYSIYLSHFFIISAVARLIHSEHIGIFIASAVPMAFLGGAIAYYYLEKPLLKRLKAYLIH